MNEEFELISVFNYDEWFCKECSYSCVLMRLLFKDKFLDSKIGGSENWGYSSWIGGKLSKPRNSTLACHLLFKEVFFDYIIKIMGL